MEIELSDEFEGRRTAVATLVRAVLARFALDEDTPRFGTRMDVGRWWRQGQEDFAGLQRDAWARPKDLPILGWLDGFPEIAPVRQMYAADPVLRDRVDTMLGAPFNLCGTNFYWILAQHVIEPVVTATRSYQFDQEAFERVHLDFESKFRATHLHMVEFRVLNGFDAATPRLELPDGLVLQRMTDSQISEAILRNAVPRMDGGGVNNARVHRYDQWALTLVSEFPVVAGYQQSDSKPLPFPMLDEPATRLVTALRLVCGGSVVATRSLAAQAEDEFPFVPSGTAALRAFSGADNDRPTIVQPENIEAVRATYQALDQLQVRADKSLQVAIRRLIFAGSRSLDSDQIIDLMTCAEALFLNRLGKKTNSKGEPVAKQAAALLATDPELGTDADRRWRRRSGAVR